MAARKLSRARGGCSSVQTPRGARGWRVPSGVGRNIPRLPVAEIPLLTHAIPGFRAWRLADGVLGPATAGRGDWSPGTNVGVCAMGHRHAVPDPDCTCGLYAFHTMHAQLSGEWCVGAIAAWGAVEVHRDGFRAERARVIALGVRNPLGHHAAALSEAAARYGVPLVDRSLLQPLALLQTAPLPVALVDLPPEQHQEWLSRRRGHEPDDQVWVEPAAGEVTVGIGRHLRDWLGAGARAEVAPGDVLERGHVLTMRGDAEAAHVPVAVAGRVTAVDGVVVRVKPSQWARDAADLRWGAVGLAAMDAVGARGADGWRHMLDAPEAGAPTSWRDVLAEMRARRQRERAPRFATAEALYDDLGIPLGQALARDRAVRQRLARLDLVLALDVFEPAARLVFDLRAGRAVLFCGDAAPPADVEIAVSGRDLVPLLSGRLDLAQEARSRRLDVRGPLATALASLAVVRGWASAQAALTG